MRRGAQIQHDYIEVDTEAWLDIVTGGPLPDLTDQLTAFGEQVHRQTSLRLNVVPLFIAARAEADWQNDEYAIIQTDDGGGTVTLSDDMIIYRYTDPSHGPVALVTTDYHHSTGTTTAYADSGHDAGEWFSYHDVDIHCPHGHGWTYRAKELIDSDGNCRTIADVFADGEILTDHQAADEGGGTESRISCPTCGQPCDVSLPGA